MKTTSLLMGMFTGLGLEKGDGSPANAVKPLTSYKLPPVLEMAFTKKSLKQSGLLPNLEDLSETKLKQLSGKLIEGCIISKAQGKEKCLLAMLPLSASLLTIHSLETEMADDMRTFISTVTYSIQK